MLKSRTNHLEVRHPYQYRATSHLFDPLYLPRGGVKLIGGDGLSGSSGAYIAPEHESLFDIPLFSRTVLKATGCSAHYVGRENLTRRFPIIGEAFGKHLLRLGIVTVNRDLSLHEQPEFVEELDRVAENNGYIVWHPEGTRTEHPNHTIRYKNLHHGIGFMAVRHGLPLFPVGARREGRPVVVIEEPIEVEKINFDLNDINDIIQVRKDIVRPLMHRLHEGMQKARLRAYDLAA